MNQQMKQRTNKQTRKQTNKWKRRVGLRYRIPTNKCRGNNGSGVSTGHHVRAVIGESPTGARANRWGLSGKTLWVSLQNTPPQTAVQLQVGKNGFMEKSDRHQLLQVIKVNATSRGDRVTSFPGVTHSEEHSTLLV